MTPFKRYSIVKHPLTGAPITILTLHVFHKKVLDKCFQQTAASLLEGESVEYMKEDEKQFYPSMLEVERKNGKLVRYTPTGKTVLWTQCNID